MSPTGKKLRVGVLFGGKSGEHEISLRSARSIIKAIDREKYTVVELGITREGRWLPPEKLRRSAGRSFAAGACHKLRGDRRYRPHARLHGCRSSLRSTD